MSTSPQIRAQGIRLRTPSGYVLGRLDPGSGEAQLIPISSLGQRLVATGAVAGGFAGALSGLRDVNLSTPATNGQILIFDSATKKWKPHTPLLTDDGDVNVTEGAGIDGYFLKWNNATGKWIAAPVSSTLAGDTDVAITSPADDDILIYNGNTAKWKNIGFPIYV